MKSLIEKIEQLEQLSEKATPGPWFVAEKGLGNKTQAPTVYATNDDLNYVATCADSLLFHGEPKNLENSQLIAASRNAIPKLCNAVREMVEVLQELVEILDDSEARKQIDSFTAQPARALLAKFGVK